MKAVVVENYDSINGISIKEMPMPDIAAGQVRVKIGAAAIGFVDGLKVQGLYQTKDPLPFIPGTEFAGVVDRSVANLKRPREMVRHLLALPLRIWNKAGDPIACHNLGSNPDIRTPMSLLGTCASRRLAELGESSG